MVSWRELRKLLEAADVSHQYSVSSFQLSIYHTFILEEVFMKLLFSQILFTF